MKESNRLKLTYNKASGKTCLETYDEGFLIKVQILRKCPPNGGVIELTLKKEVRDDLVKVIGEIKEN